MNDFTKEELSTIDYLIDSYCVHSWPPEGAYGKLKTKIQSMIDTYCEHKERTLDNRGCMKCDAIICNECLGVIK